MLRISWPQANQHNPNAGRIQCPWCTLTRDNPFGFVDTPDLRLKTDLRRNEGSSAMSEAQGDAGRPRAADRPLSPHLLNWRPHLTMTVSISHRFAGMALYGGLLIFAGWAAALAAGPDAFDQYRGLLGSPIGKLVLLALTFAAFFHLANGVRHFFWDVGYGFQPKTADTTAVAVVAFAVTATVAVWLVAWKAGLL
jgi:succinate dehydrogenase / fumarate reductase cytochrome b subunit